MAVHRDTRRSIECEREEAVVTIQRFQGACDASAATRISGTSCFAAATDEEYVLRVYDLSRPGPPLTELDVTDFLEPANRKKEPDIEGSAQIGGRIYWIGSHGRDKDAEEQESRQRLFATEVAQGSDGPALTPVGTPYKHLLEDLTLAADLREFDLGAAATLPPEAAGGLNIEGLASTPDGHLLVAFRNPQPRGRALIVRIQNPGELVSGAARAAVRLEALLDLGNRGIRAMEPAGRGRYLVLAGRFDDVKDFALFAWDGASTTPALLLDGPTLNDLNPEELLAADTPGSVQVFSDDGDAMVGAKKCKKAEPSARSFRTAVLQLAV
jgi:hypothetical protein